MRIQYCKSDYRNFTAVKLSTVSTLVRNGIFNNPIVFVGPPISEADFDTSQSDFSAAAANFKQYGITKKTVFVEARSNLIGLLNQLSSYVNQVSQGNVSLIALSGFTPSRDKYQRVQPLEKIPHFTMKLSVVSGQIKIFIPAINNKGAINYSCLCVKGAPLSNTTLINGQILMGEDNPQIHYDCNKSRRKTFNSLTPGVQYFFYVFASNSASVSPLSDCKSIFIS